MMVVQYHHNRIFISFTLSAVQIYDFHIFVTVKTKHCFTLVTIIFGHCTILTFKDNSKSSNKNTLFLTIFYINVVPVWNFLLQLYSISELKTQSSLKIDFEKYIVYIVSFKFQLFSFFHFYKPNILYIHVVPLIFFHFDTTSQ